MESIIHEFMISEVTAVFTDAKKNSGLMRKVTQILNLHTTVGSYEGVLCITVYVWKNVLLRKCYGD